VSKRQSIPKKRLRSKVAEAKQAKVVQLPGRPVRPVPLERTIAALAKLDFAFTYDLFRHQYHVGDHALQQRTGENVEHAILVLRTAVISRVKFDPGPEKMRAAVYRLCLNHAFNPVWDYLDRLKWDGIRRLDTWLTTYLGAADGPLNRAIGRKVLIAAVRRVRGHQVRSDHGVGGPTGKRQDPCRGSFQRCGDHRAERP
jgi:Virulence-associated protein E-like domain